MLRTPVVQKGTVGGLRESGSAMRIRIAMESKRATIISREIIRVTILRIVTDVVVTLILQRSVQLLSIWCRCISNQSRARRLKGTSTKLTSLDRWSRVPKAFNRTVFRRTWRTMISLSKRKDRHFMLTTC
jgi:hypothetical protein